MPAPAQQYSGPRIQAQQAPTVQFVGTAAMGDAIQSLGDVAFQVATYAANRVGEIGRQKAAKEGAAVAGQATDKNGNPIYVERQGFTTRTQAFNRAAETTYALRLNTALQSGLSNVLKTERDNPEAIQEKYGAFVSGLRKTVPGHLQSTFDRQAFALSSPHVSRAYEVRRRAAIKGNFEVLGQSVNTALNDVQELGRTISKGGPSAAAAARSLTNQFSTVIAGIDGLVDGVNLTEKGALVRKKQFASEFAMRLLMGQFQGAKNKTQMLKDVAAGTLKIQVPTIDEKGGIEFKNLPIGKALAPNDVNRLIAFMRTGIAIQKVGTGIATASVKADITTVSKAALEGIALSASARADMINRARAVGGATGTNLLRAVANYDYAQGFRSLSLPEMRAEVGRQEAAIAKLSAGGAALTAATERLELSKKILGNTATAIGRGDGIKAAVNAGVLRNLPVSVSGPVKILEPSGKERTISAAESLRLRALSQEAASEHFGTPVPFFNSDENKRVAGIFANGSLSQRLDVARTLADGVPPEKLPAVLSEIAKTNPGLSTVVGLMSIGQRQVAESLLKGAEIRRRKLIQVKWTEVNKVAVPAIAKLFPALPSGSLDATGTATLGLLESVKNAYAYLTAQAGDQGNSDPDEDRIKQSIRMVTGGVSEWNGGSFIPWSYGMDPRAAPNILQNMTIEEWRKAGGNEVPHYMRGGRAVSLGLTRLRADARLATIAPGRYFVMLPNPNGDYFPAINPSTGNRYVLDMNDIGATVERRLAEERMIGGAIDKTLNTQRGATRLRRGSRRRGPLMPGEKP